MTDVDRIIHEPARLQIMTLLASVESADFNFLLNTLGLSRGNLSSHMDRLEKAQYLEINKGYNGKTPHTDYKLTDRGREAITQYWSQIDRIRGLAKH
jgi:DNA-binding MarR family transcriptional regulator